MKLFTKAWQRRYPRLTAWGWFVILWFGGLFGALAIAAPIKLLARMLR